MSAVKTDTRHFGLFIDGAAAEPRSTTRIPTVDPTTGEEWATYANADQADVARAVGSAVNAASDGAWAKMPATDRGRIMVRVADLVGGHSDELAELETQDNGRLLRESRGQLATVPDWWFYFGGLADKLEGAFIPLGPPDAFAYTRREPLGVVGVIVPWNSPVWLTVLSITPALAAGNTVVVKPSEFASASVLRLAELAAEAGLPPGVFNVLTGDGSTGRALVEDRRVAKIAFTGGGATGAQVAASAAGRLARATVELGGKNPHIVFADADLDAAEAAVIAGIFGNAGQACVAGSRLLVENSIYDEFLDRILARAGALRIGAPRDPASDLGPIATAPQLARIEAMIAAAVDDGAVVQCGGGRASVENLPRGFFYNPTVLTGVDNRDRIAQEEVFGPVLVPLPFSSEDEAVALANASRYGLAAGVWTTTLERGHRMARRLQAGMVWLNTYKRNSYLTPFGGYKESGIGRLNGQAAVDEFLQTKTVWHEPSTKGAR